MALIDFALLYFLASLLFAFISGVVYFIFSVLRHKVNISKIFTEAWDYFKEHYKTAFPILISLAILGLILGSAEFLIPKLGLIFMPMIILSGILILYLALSYQRSVILHKKFKFEWAPIMTVLRLVFAVIIGSLAMIASVFALGITFPMVYNYFVIFLFGLYQDKTIKETSHQTHLMYKNHKYDVFAPLILMSIVLGFASMAFQLISMPLMFVHPLVMVFFVTIFSYLVISPLQVCAYAKIMEKSK